MAETIPYVRPRWGPEEGAALLEVLSSGQWTNGPYLARFEAQLAELLGASPDGEGGEGGEVVAMANGTLALYAMLAELRGLGRDEAFGAAPRRRALYLSSALNFAAGPACALRTGYEIGLVDIDPETLNMSPAALSALLERVRGDYELIVVNPVLFAGSDAGLDAIAELAQAHDAVLFEDGCHGLGLFRQGGEGLRHWQPAACSMGAVFSFHPTKNVASGEGGAVFTRSPELAARLRMLRNHNMDRSGGAPELATTRGARNPWFYEVATPGLNLRLSEFHAAIAHVQLGRLAANRERRLAIADRYHHAFASDPRLRCRTPARLGDSAYHLFPVTLEDTKVDRFTLFERLFAEGVRPQVHYVPLHQQPAFADQPLVASARFPGLDAIGPRLLSLPMFPELDEAAQRRVLAALDGALGGR